MIQATDLRIGNWLKRLDDTYFQVNSADFLYIEELNTRLRPLPIPITEEILLKCGFEKNENNWLSLCICEEWIFIYWEKLAGLVLTINHESSYLPHIKHLNQLQNLTFALTNTELNITL